MSKITLVFGPGGNSLMYSDAALKMLRPVVEKITRLTTIDYDLYQGHWMVHLAINGQSLFADKRRDVCLLWEEAHAAELIQQTQQIQQAVQSVADNRSI